MQQFATQYEQCMLYVQSFVSVETTIIHTKEKLLLYLKRCVIVY